MLTAEYCLRTEIQKIEQESWNLTMKGDDIDGYINHFHELSVMCPTLVTPEYKKNERYIWWLPERVQGNVTSSKPATIHEAVSMTCGLVDQAIRAKATRISDTKKRKWKCKKTGHQTKDCWSKTPAADTLPTIDETTIYETKTRVAYNSIDKVARQGVKVVKNVKNKRKWESGYGGNSSQRQNKQQKVTKAYAAGPNSKRGHQSKDCMSKTPAIGSNSKPAITCFGCGEQRNYKNRCLQLKNQNRCNQKEKKGKAF
ncbi:hypothetical protein Tco_0938470 [Tanacetum coccineum]|uniref:CCHC-type domain-containing protein n=1 Tax=Tanacetum coccineum TaxID=301880 RepID=A0ABQ5DHW9_9ASTR